MSSVLVSVIVPCFNYGHLLGEALASVELQTYQHWECIIVNDGSPDNTEDVAGAFCVRDKRFRYFHQDNKGHSAARNMGIRMSSGTYILPLDADDTISATYIEQAVKTIISGTKIKLVTGQVQLFGDSDIKHVMPAYSLKSYLLYNYISITSMFSRSDFDNAGGFDESLLGFEDWDLFIKLLKHGGVVVELPIIGLYYRKKQMSVFTTVLNDKKIEFRDLLKVYNNNIDVYERYFKTPIDLIRENEKMDIVIANYQKSRTYKIGSVINKFKKSLFKP